MFLVSSCHRAHKPWPWAAKSRGIVVIDLDGRGMSWDLYSSETGSRQHLKGSPCSTPAPTGLKKGVDRAVNELADLAKPHS